jgi:peroxiredoxin
MAPTPSSMLPLGTLAPSFSLPDVVSGKTVSLDTLRSPTATVVMFICNHCPYVKHVQDELARLARELMPLGVSFVAISSNDVSHYPEDAPEQMCRVAQTVGYPFPYLYDQSQSVARAYDAACTPDFYVFDGALQLAYRGRLDDSSPGNGRPVTGKDLRTAIRAVHEQRPIPDEQHPSMGCSIKWKH